MVAQRFDPKSRTLTGPLVSVAPSVYYFYTSKWAGFTVSRTGSTTGGLVVNYTLGGTATIAGEVNTVFVVDGSASLTGFAPSSPTGATATRRRSPARPARRPVRPAPV